MQQRLTDEQLQRYIEFDPFLDCDRDDVTIRNRKVTIVKTRKPQMCVSLSSKAHEIPPGTMARRESAIIDGSFGAYYYCLECCDREMTPGFWEKRSDVCRQNV